MLVIKDDNFEMVQTSGPFFDLNVLTKVNEGKENEREEMKLIAHGLPFDSCLKQLVQLKIDKSKTYSVTEYIEAFAKGVDEISKLIKEVDKSKKEENE